MAAPNTRLRELREANGLTQADLAQKIGVVQSAISFAENGERELRDDVKAVVARFFGVSVDWLFFEGRYLSSRLEEKGA